MNNRLDDLFFPLGVDFVLDGCSSLLKVIRWEDVDFLVLLRPIAFVREQLFLVVLLVGIVVDRFLDLQTEIGEPAVQIVLDHSVLHHNLLLNPVALCLLVVFFVFGPVVVLVRFFLFLFFDLLLHFHSDVLVGCLEGLRTDICLDPLLVQHRLLHEFVQEFFGVYDSSLFIQIVADQLVDVFPLLRLFFFHVFDWFRRNGFVFWRVGFFEFLVHNFPILFDVQT